MNKKVTVTIGIPAYNEETNIGLLLKDIAKQKYNGFIVTKIIISSDGSTDKTVSIAKKFPSEIIQIIANRQRQGIARGMNQIFKASKTDIVVLLDADIRIFDKLFIAKLIQPIVKQTADLTSSAIDPLPSKSYFSKILAVSMRYKFILFNNIRKGNNIYTCYGLARAFSKRFYKQLPIPTSIGNDMYSYLACMKRGFTFRHVANSVAYYHLPANFADHSKQSSRFLATGGKQTQYFDPQFVHSETKIGISTYLFTIGHLASVLIKYPIETFLYACVQLLIIYGEKPISSKKHTWDIAISSKK